MIAYSGRQRANVADNATPAHVAVLKLIKVGGFGHTFSWT
jgi:hypothetical protein